MAAKKKSLIEQTLIKERLPEPLPIQSTDREKLVALACEIGLIEAIAILNAEHTKFLAAKKAFASTAPSE